MKNILFGPYSDIRYTKSIKCLRYNSHDIAVPMVRHFHNSVIGHDIII